MRFFSDVYFEGGASRIYTNQMGIFLKILQVEGLQLYQKYASLQIFSKSFAQICSYLQGVSRNFINLCFPENLLVAAASRCKVFNIFSSIKVTEYMQAVDYGLRKHKKLNVLNGNLIVLKWPNIHVISNLKYTAIYTKTRPSSLLYIMQRLIQNPFKRLSKDITSLEVTIFIKKAQS